MTEEEKLMLEDYKDSGTIQGSTLTELFASDLSGFTYEFLFEIRELYRKELMK